MTTLYLIRHGEAMGNVSGTFQGHTDCEISENGKLQLELLKEKFKSIPFDTIYSSPLKRACQTAEAVNFYKNYELKKKYGLIEINGGVFEGKKWSELEEVSKKSRDLWFEDFANFEVENGDSMKTVFERMKAAVLEIVRENEGKTVVAVSHGCAIRAFVCYAKGLELKDIEEVKWSDNTGVTKLKFESCDALPTVVYENDVTHLPPELIGKKKWLKKQ